MINITSYCQSQVRWEDVIAENKGLRSIDCAWNLSKKCYEIPKKFCYVFLSLIFGPCVACCMGMQFACLAFSVRIVFYQNVYIKFIPNLNSFSYSINFCIYINSMCGVWDHFFVASKQSLVHSKWYSKCACQHYVHQCSKCVAFAFQKSKLSINV